MALAIILILELAVERLHFQALIVAQAVVQHARDGVGTVLGRRAVAQHFEVLDADRWERGQVRTLRTERQRRVAADVDLHQRRAVEALAVHHHEDLIGRQAAERW